MKKHDSKHQSTGGSMTGIGEKAANSCSGHRYEFGNALGGYYGW